MMPRKSNASAVARTLPMPGVVQEAVTDGNAVREDGPRVRACVLLEDEDRGACTHLTQGRDTRASTLCGLPLLKRLDEWGSRGKVCEACRVEASRMRAVVV